MEIKDIHVAFDGASYSSLEQMLFDEGKYENFKDFRILPLYHALTYGDVSEVPFSMPEVIKHWYITMQDAVTCLDRYLSVLEKAQPDVGVKLWVDFNVAEEFLNFCYFAKLFCRFQNVEAVITDYRVKNMSTKDWLKYSQKIDAAELMEYSSMWDAAKRENKAIRYVKNGEIFSVDADFFDDIVLNCVTDKYRPFGRIYNLAHEKVEKTLGIYLGYETFEEILIRLAEGGAVVPRVPYGWTNGDFMFIDDSFKRVV